ncbi:SBBP repeat-containing protein, partial [Candidatus Microgenomates bacterium]|nr:SBBP repeat-containing protein [Candidatus Microgenomates bacterium]
MTGYTLSPNFPLLHPFQAAHFGNVDVFVAKLNSNGTALVYSTYLGGSGDDNAIDLAVTASGKVHITGYTNSVNFPTVGAIQPAIGGGADAFVSKIDATGSALIYSTYLGGPIYDIGRGIAVDGYENAYITGQRAGNVFVDKVNSTGSSLVYTKSFGGTDTDEGRDIVVDALGTAYVTGRTSSNNFPTVNPVQPNNGGGIDGFLLKLNAPGTLVYSTYLGGRNEDWGNGLAADSQGNMHVAGQTRSDNFPVANAIQPAFGGGPVVGDAFIAKLNALGSELIFSTYLGGSADDLAWGITLDNSGNAYVTGSTTSTNFPISNATQAVFGGGISDAFVSILNPVGSTLIYSSFLGGNGGEYGYSVGVDVSGDLLIAGSTSSDNFPTINALQQNHGGYGDVFMTKLSTPLCTVSTPLSVTGSP